MSEIRATTISDLVGTGPVTLTAQWSPRAYCNIATNGALTDGGNISSIDDDGSGDRGVNFSSSFDSADYTIVIGVNDEAAGSGVIQQDVTDGTQATGSVDLETYYVNSGTNRTNDDRQGWAAFIGDLA